MEYGRVRAIGGSSNGRTGAFEALNLGSTPSPPALRLATLAQCRPYMVSDTIGV